MNIETQNVICTAWMILRYKNHTNPIVKTSCREFYRYEFYYSNEETPFFVLVLYREQGSIQEWTRIDDILTLTRIGYPIFEDEEKNTNAEFFGLFLNRSKCGVEWVRV